MILDRLKITRSLSRWHIRGVAPGSAAYKQCLNDLRTQLDGWNSYYYYILAPSKPKHKSCSSS